MTIRAIAWDIDGTLVDSEPLHHRCLIETCLAMGLDLRADPAERFLGAHLSAIWDILSPDLPAGLQRQDWVRAIHDRYVAQADTLVPIDGAQEIVRDFARAGIRQVAVSNSGRRIVDANLGALGIAGFLETSFSIDDVSRGKPDPEPYLRGVGFLGLDAAEVMAVEDSETGGRSALAAGLRLAGLGWAGALPGAHAITGLRELPGLVGV